jgi:membrane-bound lytic murein transglycosylase D
MRTQVMHVSSGTTLATIAFLAMLAMALPAPGSDADQFPVPPSLVPQVNFWVDVFSRYGKRQVVIHDTERLNRIYSVLDMSDLDAEGLTETQIELAMKAGEDDEKGRIRGLLRQLDGVDPSSAYLTDEQRRLIALFAGDPSPSKFADAAAEDRVRGQRGLRERFARGLQIAHAYFPAMERIFIEEGVPPEITRLPMVESCFNVHAYSKVGAAGVWQFMPATARNYMRIDGVVDERLDPLISTRAAARFMRQNYEMLGTWPLAIKAYNHGPAGIARAVREVGTTDAATIIENYHGPAYKFASRNFYPEFLAALYVDRNYQTYFGDIALDAPLSADTVLLTQHTPIITAARCAGVDQWDIAALNPSLLASIHAGQRPIPSGYELRLPHGTRDRFRECIAAQPAPRVQMAARVPPSRRSLGRGARERAIVQQQHVVHKVKRGQTLAQIATLYGCSIEQLRRGNRLKGNAIHAGQLLRIPLS